MFKSLFQKIVGDVQPVQPEKPQVQQPQQQPPQQKQQQPQSVKLQPSKEELLKVQQEILEMRQKAEADARRIVQEAVDAERRIADREGRLEIDKKTIEEEKQKAQKLRAELEVQKESLLAKLEKAAGLTKEQAKDLLLKGWEEKLTTDIAQRIKTAEEEFKQKAEARSKELVVDALRYGATDYVPEFTLSTISLPSDDYKGRIIGKDGRNIRAFELATGVDVDLEEEGSIKISSFDAIRREVARISLEQLIKDGRIQPQKIEEIVAKNKREIEKVMSKAGEELAQQVGVYNLPPEVIAALGKFKYRFSYGQNMIVHTLEETKIGIALAHELKLDVNVVRLGCLFHDIGKVVDKEGSHVDTGVEFLRQYGFPETVVGCVASSHEDIPFPSLEAVVVHISDAISGARPGARHEDFQQYLKRITGVEEAARGHRGVRDVYALQAGRELRVVVRPDEISDDEATVMASKIKSDLEKKFNIFPGNIKISVIREFRAEQTAKFN